MNCIERRLVDAHFAGTIAPADERSMLAHVVTCSPCRQHFRRHLLVARLDPAALPASERIGRGLGFSPSERRRLAPWIGVIALAAAVFLFFRFKDDGFTARGSVAVTSETPLTVFRVPRGEGPTLAATELARDDELAFVYRNIDRRGYLLVFGVTDGGRVHWFYPAWTDERQNPTAVPIQVDPGAHELGDAIRHRVNGSKLEVHALFVDRPVTVKEVESLVANRTGPLTLYGGVDHVTTFALRP